MKFKPTSFLLLFIALFAIAGIPALSEEGIHENPEEENVSHVTLMLVLFMLVLALITLSWKCVIAFGTGEMADSFKLLVTGFAILALKEVIIILDHFDILKVWSSTLNHTINLAAFILVGIGLYKISLLAKKYGKAA